MIRSDSFAVTPEKLLAQVILNDTTGTLFGEQQDIHESMDNIIDMLDVIVAQANLDNSKLFFGKLRQLVQYHTPQGEKKVLTKEEDFHQVIVEVHPCLYDTLDHYFASQEVFSRF